VVGGTWFVNSKIIEYQMNLSNQWRGRSLINAYCLDRVEHLHLQYKFMYDKLSHCQRNHFEYYFVPYTSCPMPKMLCMMRKMTVF
jgi:hypothetical protein